MKILKILGLSLLVIVLLIALLSFILPTSFSVERSITIDAPKGLVTDQVAKFRNFHAWSPWSPKDPKMEITIEGPDGEVGSIYTWKGETAGEGSQEIVGKTDERIDIELIFIKPFATKNMTFYLIDENPGSTTVTWGMEGSTPRPYNVMGLFMNMEEMVGNDYEQGLVNLKERVELLYEQKKKTSSIRVVTEFERTYAAKKGEVAFSEIASFYQLSVGELSTRMEAAGLEMSGYPGSIYYDWDEVNEITQMAVVIPVSDMPDEEEIELVMINGHGFFMEHTGSYAGLKEIYKEMEAYVERENRNDAWISVEEYITNAATGHPEEEWLTRVYFIWED